MSTREDIATALTETGLVRVTPGYRSTIKAHEGIVKWAGRVPGDEGLGYLDTWEIWLGVGADLAAAEAWLTDHLDALISSLDRVALVTGATPAELVLGANIINGLILEAVATADPPPPVADPVTPYATEEV